MGRAWIVALALIASAALAFADEDTAATRAARDHFTRGSALFHEANFAAAIVEFEVGYGLAKKPGFLLNLALSHKMLGHFAKARELLLEYVRQAPPGDSERKRVPGLLVEIDRAIASAPQSIAPPSATPIMAPSDGETHVRRRWVAPVVVAGAAAVVVAIVAVILVAVLSVDYGARTRSSCQDPGCVLIDRAP